MFNCFILTFLYSFSLAGTITHFCSISGLWIRGNLNKGSDAFESTLLFVFDFAWCREKVTAFWKEALFSGAERYSLSQNNNKFNSNPGFYNSGSGTSSLSQSSSDKSYKTMTQMPVCAKWIICILAWAGSLKFCINGPLFFFSSKSSKIY